MNSIPIRPHVCVTTVVSLISIMKLSVSFAGEQDQSDIDEIRMFLTHLSEAELHHALFITQTIWPTMIETELEARFCLDPVVQTRQDEIRASTQMMRVHLRRHLRESKPLDPQMATKGQEAQKVIQQIANCLQTDYQSKDGTYIRIMHRIFLSTNRAVLLVCLHALEPNDIAQMEAAQLDAFINWICLHAKDIGHHVVEEWADRLEIPTRDQTLNDEGV